MASPGPGRVLKRLIKSFSIHIDQIWARHLNPRPISSHFRLISTSKKLKTYPKIDQIPRTPISSSRNPPILVLPIARRASSSEYDSFFFRGKLLTEIKSYEKDPDFFWKILVLGPRQNLKKCDVLQKSIMFIYIYICIHIYFLLRILCYVTRFPQGLFCSPKMTPRKKTSMYFMFFDDFC